jgi:hypothetical protein
MNRRRSLVLLGVVGLIMALSLPTDVVSATQTFDWSEDFSDGNYDGWNITAGAFAVTDGKLTVTEVAPGPALPVILHPSNATFGNWTFDVEIGDDPELSEHVLVNIMRDEYSADPWSGIHMEYLGAWTLCRGLDVFDSFGTVREWEHHFLLQRTRDDPNHIKVYHNGTLMLNTLILVPYLDNASFCFSFAGTRGATVDNINVEYEPPFPDETTTSTTDDTSTDDTTTTDGGNTGGGGDQTMILLIAGGGAVAVIVIVIIIKMRS